MGSGGGGGGGMGDIFDILSGGGRRQQPRERRGENVVHRLKVGLEEMYKGGIRKLSLSRNIKCDQCGGSGTKSGKRYQCEVGPAMLTLPSRASSYCSSSSLLVQCLHCTQATCIDAVVGCQQVHYMIHKRYVTVCNCQEQSRNSADIQFAHSSTVSLLLP